MRIASITNAVVHVSAKTNWHFVRVVASDGTEGVGEASLNGYEPLVELVVRELAGRLVGQPVDEALPLLATHPHATAGLVAHAAKSALRQALVDVAARAAGVPAWQWLGGRRRDAVPVYANVNRATTDRTPDGCAASAVRAVAEGFAAVKIAPFDEVLPDELDRAPTRRAIDAGIERVLAMRAAIGPAPRLMVDCHWRFDEPTALAVLDRLAAARLHWFECPVSEQPGAHAALGRLAAAARERGVLLAGCELQTAVAGFRPFVDGGLVDAIMPDVKYCGGPVEMLRIAALARERGVLFSPHNPTGPIATYASLHAAIAASAVYSLELQVWESPLTAALTGGVAPALVDGAFAAPAGPGWGVTLDTAVAAAHPYRAAPPGLDERLG
jgi:galactonate dehydratase